MPPRVEKVERVADLLLLLLNANEPLTLVQIGSQVKGYPSEEEARRTQFERDKRTLRESGIPITVSAPNSSAQDGYQILSADYYLPDLNLTDSERNALRLALSSVRFEGTIHAEIAVKIGAEPGASLPAVMELPRAPALGQLGEAIRARAHVTFSYRERERTVAPEVLAFRSGHWYLIGQDRGVLDGDARRTYRVDRISGAIEIGAPGEIEVRDDAELAHELAFSLRAPSIEERDDKEARPVLELLVDASATAAVIELVGNDAVLERDDRGRARVTFPIADEEAVVSWILGLGPAAEVIAPVELRDLVVDRLRDAIDEPSVDPADFPEIAKITTSSTDEHARKERRPVLDAGARLRRIIAMLTYLANEGSASISELAKKFGVDAKTVVSELELAACFGLPPYTPDQLLEILVIDDEVHVNSLEALERPLRLTSDEGFALAASARTLLRTTGVDAESPLAGALKKLEAVLGQNHLHVEVEIPSSLQLLQTAAATQTVVDIDYPAIEETKPTRRRVEPYAVVFREGKFYLDAFCHFRNDWRRFLVANIAEVVVTDIQGEVRTPPAEYLGSRAFVEGPATPRATIVVPAQSQYFIEPLTSLPIEPLGDGRILVTLAVGSERWLGGLLLRLGAGAQVVAPPSLQKAKAIGAAAALARYS